MYWNRYGENRIVKNGDVSFEPCWTGDTILVYYKGLFSGYIKRKTRELTVLRPDDLAAQKSNANVCTKLQADQVRRNFLLHASARISYYTCVNKSHLEIDV